MAQTDGKKFGVYNLRFYKARSDNKGSASQFGYKPDNNCVFVDFAPQVPSDNQNSKFDWEKSKLTMKLGLPDLGELIAVLRGLKKGAGPEGQDGKFKGIYHTSGDSGDSSLALVERDVGGWTIKIGIRRGKTPLKTCGHPLTYADGMILLIYLESAVTAIIGFGQAPQTTPGETDSTSHQ